MILDPDGNWIELSPPGPDSSESVLRKCHGHTKPNRAARTAASKPSSTRLMPYSTSATTLPQSALVSALHPAQRTLSARPRRLFDLVKSCRTLRYENHIARRP